jgi:spore coat protein H
MRWASAFVVAACVLVTGCAGDGGGPPDQGPDGGGPDGRAVDPGADASDVDAGPVAPLDPAAMIFDESVVRTYRITMDPDDWQWLNDNGYLEEYRPASMELEGEHFDLAAIRFKGSSGTLNRCYDENGVRRTTASCAKLSIKLSFNEYDDDGKFRGLKKLNFHSMGTDRTKMHDALGYKLFRDHGVPASRTAFANLEVNGEAIGLYVVVENVDGRFTRRRFPDGGEGNLYKEIWPTDRTKYRYERALVTNEDEDPSVDRMLRFGGELLAAPEGQFAATLDAWTDLDQLIGYFAVARLIDHWDDVVTFYCWTPSGRCVNHNYYWYESTAEDKVWLIAWDLDHTFEEPSPLRTYYGMPDWDEVDADCEWFPMAGGVMARAPACDPILRRIVLELWDDYVASSQALLDGPYAAPTIHARVDHLEELLTPHVAADPYLSSSAWRSAVDSLHDVIEEKRQYIAAKIMLGTGP